LDSQPGAIEQRACDFRPRTDAGDDSCDSTGAFGYPVELAVAVAVNTVPNGLQEFTAIQEAVFCCFSASDRATYQAALNKTAV
jgi:O-acetyl-ADP-ribose deacetylase (regulator of RNase III)